MAKKKVDRNLHFAGHAQVEVEKKAVDKFEKLEKKAQEKIPTYGRYNKQISCTVPPHDKKLLDDLALYLSNKNSKVLNTSIVIRALIHLGHKYKDELEI